MPAPSPIRLRPSPKGHTRDLDKAVDPEETFRRVSHVLASRGQDIFAGALRVDAGRLGIPVYMGVCGPRAREIIPARKQMGKGSSEAQARASALMELVERYSFFSFFRRRPNFVRASWDEAEQLFGENLIPAEEIALSASDATDPALVRRILNLRRWDFHPATRLRDGRIAWLPLDWFRMLGEFNGSSAGNANEESIMQGAAELVERHVCALVDARHPVLPTIDPAACGDETLRRLVAAFAREGIMLLLKDVSLGMPLPSVAALAFDPATFPQKSEIVFTAGTASSPLKAAIRAITEVAQLGGDFCSSSCYEASGLGKFSRPEEFAWLLDGEKTTFEAMPDISAPDFREEVLRTAHALAPLNLYAADTTCPELGIPAHYCMIPGLLFRERDKNQSVGLFTGRKLAEAGDEEGLAKLAALCPDAHYLPFFAGLVALGKGESREAARLFAQAVPAQPDAEARALSLFYQGHALALDEAWSDACAPLEEAFGLCPSVKEYGNLLGAARYRLKDYAGAERIFDAVLRLDKGSAPDLANRGICRKMLGDKAAARRDLRQALELDPALDYARKHLDELAEDGDYPADDCNDAGERD